MMAAHQNMTAVSDEEIISALLNSGTITAAARAVGISNRTIYDRMGTRKFKAAYAAAKADIIRSTVLTMQHNLAAAVETITEIMENKDNPPGIRLSAAKMLMDNTAKFSGKLAESDRFTGEQYSPSGCCDPARW